jgi:DNA-binding transcriptional ArsR family regulator
MDVTSSAATAALDALGSETARALVAALADRPAPASDLADAVDTSLQNVQYHLEALREAGLVVDAGTWYSSRGREMTVYALGSERLEFRVASPDGTDRSETPPSSPERERPPTDVPSAD